MTPIPQIHAPADLRDPRSRSDFRPQLYPKANGKDAPPHSAVNRNDRIMLDFLAVYYDINCEYSRLLEVRQRPDSAQRREAERKQLQAIEKLLILRDSLEDRYAPFGVIAEPRVKQGFIVDLKISFGNVDAAGRRRSDLYTITTYIPIPLPGPLRIEDLPMKIEGPGINSK